ncbi:MAG: hypothetical protein K6B67_04890 [Lachnospiraceae bacterium]|nr:hypothetical protein [Lachnospiraceae bacterium]
MSQAKVDLNTNEGFDFFNTVITGLIKGNNLSEVIVGFLLIYANWRICRTYECIK